MVLDRNKFRTTLFLLVWNRIIKLWQKRIMIFALNFAVVQVLPVLFMHSTGLSAIMIYVDQLDPIMMPSFPISQRLDAESSSLPASWAMTRSLVFSNAGFKLIMRLQVQSISAWASTFSAQRSLRIGSYAGLWQRDSEDLQTRIQVRELFCLRKLVASVSSVLVTHWQIWANLKTLTAKKISWMGHLKRWLLTMWRVSQLKLDSDITWIWYPASCLGPGRRLQAIQVIWSPEQDHQPWELPRLWSWLARVFSI